MDSFRMQLLDESFESNSVECASYVAAVNDNFVTAIKRMKPLKR